MDSQDKATLPGRNIPSLDESSHEGCFWSIWYEEFSHVTPGSSLPSLLVSGFPEVGTQAKYTAGRQPTQDLTWLGKMLPLRCLHSEFGAYFCLLPSTCPIQAQTSAWKLI